MKHQNFIHRHEVGCHPDIGRHDPMDLFELRKIMRKLGCYSQADLAKLIGVSRPTVSLWCQGKVSIPKPIAMLLRIMLVEKIRGKTGP